MSMDAAVSNPTGNTIAEQNIYTQIESYHWSSDEEFQSGLQAIINSAAPFEDPRILSLRARCFYYSRKFNTPVDPEGYIQWHEQQQQHRQPEPQQEHSMINGNHPADLERSLSTPSFSPHHATTAAPAAPPAPDTAPSSEEPQPPYPTSFAHLVDLITSGQPVPGVKEIPNTILEGHGTQSAALKRKKPWEKDDGRATGG